MTRLSYLLSTINNTGWLYPQHTTWVGVLGQRNTKCMLWCETVVTGHQSTPAATRVVDLSEEGGGKIGDETAQNSSASIGMLEGTHTYIDIYIHTYIQTSVSVVSLSLSLHVALCQFMKLYRKMRTHTNADTHKHAGTQKHVHLHTRARTQIHPTERHRHVNRKLNYKPM